MLRVRKPIGNIIKSLKRRMSSRRIDFGSKCDEAVDHLVKKGINFLAVDFDKTFIDVHTGGRFKGTLAELSACVRPMFIHLFKAAHSKGIKIAIVTFSPQTRHISDVLEIHFPEFAHEIVIRGRDNTWKYEGNGMRNGKQEFMASAAEELLNKYGQTMEITKQTTLLLDDDDSNIEMALKDGVRAIWINPDRSYLLIGDILDMP